jgi:hypothetical protein
MLTARAAMPTAAKDPYLINKITFFQCFIFATNCKDTLSQPK